MDGSRHHIHSTMASRTETGSASYSERASGAWWPLPLLPRRPPRGLPQPLQLLRLRLGSRQHMTTPPPSSLDSVRDLSIESRGIIIIHHVSERVTRIATGIMPYIFHAHGFFASNPRRLTQHSTLTDAAKPTLQYLPVSECSSCLVHYGQAALREGPYQVLPQRIEGVTRKEGGKQHAILREMAQPFCSKLPWALGSVISKDLLH